MKKCHSLIFQILFCFGILFAISIFPIKTLFSASADDLSEDTTPTYKISFVTNCDISIDPIELNEGDEITLPNNPERAGWTFVGWFLDNETFENEFSETQMPANDLTLYANWTRIQYIIYFISDGGLVPNEIYGYYGDEINELQPASKTGYTFAGWFYDRSYNETVVTPLVIGERNTKNLILYARWRPNTYYIYFETNCSITLQPKGFLYNETIVLDEPTRSGYIFDGWFYDNETFKNKFNETTMNDKNLVLYASWSEKENIGIDESTQTFSYDEKTHSFSSFSNLSNFNVAYLVNGEWTSSLPIDAGAYDVKITRAEDDTYKSFEKVIAGGLVISPKIVDITWIIALLFILAFMEISTSIFVRHLRKIKSSKTFVFVPFGLILANSVLGNSQTVLLSVSGGLALFGFVLLIYEIVKLIKTNPDYSFVASKYDNRKNIKSISDDEDDFKTMDMLKSKEPVNTYTFSADDINNMLNDPNYFDKNRKVNNNNSDINQADFDDLSDETQNQNVQSESYKKNLIKLDDDEDDFVDDQEEFDENVTNNNDEKQD